MTDYNELAIEIETASGIAEMIEQEEQEKLKQEIMAQNKMNVLKAQGVIINKPFAEALVEELK